MSAESATKYKAMVARCNFLGYDRPDVQFAAKEAARLMAQPCEGEGENISRIGKYLNGKARRLVQVFPFGADDGVVRAYSD